MLPRTLLLFVAFFLQQVGPTDIEQVLEKAEKILEEAKTLYETGRDEAQVSSLVEAGFKLEEARIKDLVVQEIGQGEKQKVAAKPTFSPRLERQGEDVTPQRSQISLPLAHDACNLC